MSLSGDRSGECAVFLRTNSGVGREGKDKQIGFSSLKILETASHTAKQAAVTTEIPRAMSLLLRAVRESNVLSILLSIK